MALATPIFQRSPLTQYYFNIWHWQSRKWNLRIRGLLYALSFWSILFFGLPYSIAAEQTRADFVKRAKRIFDRSQAAYQRDTNNVDTAWQFARATFDLANQATKSSERAEIAQQGIAVARQAVAMASNSAPAHYYLGMNLAQLAQTKFLGALKIVNEMEREFSIVRNLDAKFDDAGADRNLGLLYRDAPAIGSIGSRPKAREHLQNAVKLAPESPDNRLNLIDTYLKWGETESAKKELQALEEMWPRARANLNGEQWESSWPDWEARLKKAKGKLTASVAR